MKWDLMNEMIMICNLIAFIDGSLNAFISYGCLCSWNFYYFYNLVDDVIFFLSYQYRERASSMIVFKAVAREEWPSLCCFLKYDTILECAYRLINLETIFYAVTAVIVFFFLFCLTMEMNSWKYMLYVLCSPILYFLNVLAFGLSINSHGYAIQCYYLSIMNWLKSLTNSWSPIPNFYR